MEADALARKMLTSMNENAWSETKVLSWRFPRGHEHVWDRQRNLASVIWGKNIVLLDLGRRSGRVWQKDSEVFGETRDLLLKKAWALWANDSFWLTAPLKIFDEGTTRELIELADGEQGLLVTYNSGGVTPGDAYLWLLDEGGVPQGWMMWVSIIPFGGLETSWEGWDTLTSGARYAPIHNGGLFSVNLMDVKGVKTMAELFGEEDPFAPIL